MKVGKYTKRAETLEKDEKTAVAQLHQQLYQDNLAGIIFFCSPDYNLDILASELNAAFRCQLIGCTTAGEIGSTYQTSGIVAVSFSSEKFCLHPYAIHSLNDFTFNSSRAMAEELTESLEFSDKLNSTDMFGLLLIDGLSVMEEPLTAAIHSALQGVQLIGGSAGDSLEFKETKVFIDGKFSSDSAVFTLIESRLPFELFKLQHFKPSENEMVITVADTKNRIVYEIDGGQAAEEYADILGLSASELDSHIFAMHPLMLQIGSEWYVRSIQKINEDGSLTFFCAIDEGLPLTVAEGIGLVDTLKEKVEHLQSGFSSIELTIGCDCILRRLEISENEQNKAIETELDKVNFLGFSTFGEQFNSIHVNQTLTAVVIGEKGS